MQNVRMNLITHLDRGLAVAIIGAMLVCVGCRPEQRELLEQFGNSLPQLRQHSIQPPAPDSRDTVAFTAVIDPKGRGNPEFFIDLLGQSGQGSRRLDAGCQRNGDLWNCDARALLYAGTYRVQWVVFFDFPGGVVNGTRSFMTFPSPAVPLTVSQAAGQAPGGGAGLGSAGCDPTTSAPTMAPAIEVPLDGTTCVGQRVADKASVVFRFADVAEACGRGAFQIEIQRLDAGCAPVSWTRTGSGLSEIGRCWIADQNVNEHAEVLDQATQYRWRVRANSSSSTGGAGPFSGFQSFTTGGPPVAPVFATPLEGSTIKIGTASGITIPVTWQSTGCGAESFNMTVFEDNQQAATISGSGNTTMVSVRSGRAYRIDLKVTSIWGTSPLAQLRFSIQ